jgi:hypothetical protein
MKTLKTIKLGKVEIRLEQIASKGNILGYIISKFDSGVRCYLSSPETLEETKEHFDFYINVYK